MQELAEDFILRFGALEEYIGRGRCRGSGVDTGITLDACNGQSELFNVAGLRTIASATWHGGSVEGLIEKENRGLCRKEDHCGVAEVCESAHSDR